jgi:hypothetical protein
MPLHLLFDIQHAGRPDKPADMGAAFDLDGDGVTGENGEREVDLVRAYVAAAATCARSHGHRVTVLEAGTYGQRHAEAVRIAGADPMARCVYLACHTNAGGGTYGLLRPDYRSNGGLAVAERLAAGLRRLPALSRVRIDPLYPDAATAGKAGRDVSNAGQIGWWTRGWGCIDGIYAGPANLSAVLVEPFFIDAPAHRPLMTPAGLATVGQAIVRGCAT